MQLCESFNQFSYNVVPSLNIPKSLSDENPIMSIIKSFEKHPRIVKIMIKVLVSTLHFRKTSCNKVEKIISNLNFKNSCQIEDIPTKIIKMNKDLIAKFTAGNFNSCIDEVEFPSELLHADIVPIHKKKDTSSKSNNRLLSILSTYFLISKSVWKN